MMSRRRSGFSLIEALVALTVAALVLGAIFELQLQMARGQRRAIAALDRVAAAENAIALTRDLNPMAAPTGQIALPDGDVVRWDARARGVARVNAGVPFGDGVFEVQLFTVTVSITRPSGQSPAPLVFDRIGWRRLSSEQSSVQTPQ